jgi:hypothetical protein
LEDDVLRFDAFSFEFLADPSLRPTLREVPDGHPDVFRRVERPSTRALRGVRMVLYRKRGRSATVTRRGKTFGRVVPVRATLPRTRTGCR